jgi:hypothetical protein
MVRTQKRDENETESRVVKPKIEMLINSESVSGLLTTNSKDRSIRHKMLMFIHNYVT